MSCLRVAGVAVLVAGLACSLVIQPGGQQCKNDSDCMRFDAGVTLACVSGVCAGPGGPCNVTADCTSRSGGQPAICRRDTKQCATLLSSSCPKVYGNYQSDDAVVLGSILSLSGSAMSSGMDEINSAELAMDDFNNTVVGLPGAADGKPRPLVLVECDDDSGDDQNNKTLLASANHLVTDIGVPAILGPDWSGGVTAAIDGVTIPAKVLLISPAATSATLSGISQYFWRTSPSDDIQAIPLRNSVQEVATANGIGTIKLAVMYKNDSYGMGLYNAVTGSLMINGAAVTDPSNNGNFDPQQYDPSSMSDMAMRASNIVTFQPNIVLLIGTNEVISSGLDAIEATWPGGMTPPPRPLYLVSDGGEVQELIDAVTKDTTGTLRKRIRGTVPGTTNPLFQAFSLEYQGKYGSAPNVFGMAGSYDSIYLLAYSVTAIPSGRTVDGTGVSDGMQLMIGGTPINVGTMNMQAALSTLSTGKDIAINGASGPLHFDPNLHEAPSDIDVWCVILGGTGTPQFGDSHRSYSAETSMMVGTYSCP